MLDFIVTFDLRPVKFNTANSDQFLMKQWIQKLVQQLDFSVTDENGKPKTPSLSEDRATLLYFLDTYGKNLFEVENHPVRQVREELDHFVKELVKDNDAKNLEKTFFRLRQFFSMYRTEEYSYVRKSFEEFKGIIWDFIDQLSEDFHLEQAENREIAVSLYQLKEAVEADAIDDVRARSREFIDFYVEKLSKKEQRRSKRMKTIKKNLNVMKKQLVEAKDDALLDHLTKANNRKSFDAELKQQWQLFQLSHHPVSMIFLDIDYFKKVNDQFGHQIGDFVLQQCVKLLKETFNKETDFVARIGGEEFAIILPEHTSIQSVKRAEEAMQRIRKEVFVEGNVEIRFTVSMGIAQLNNQETAEDWYKRADAALYQSKNAGRNRYTVSGLIVDSSKVAS